MLSPKRAASATERPAVSDRSVITKGNGGGSGVGGHRRAAAEAIFWLSVALPVPTVAVRGRPVRAGSGLSEIPQKPAPVGER